jgi:hypothetical protein
VIVKYTVFAMYLLSSGLALGIWYLHTSIKPHQEQWNIVIYIVSTLYHGLMFFFLFITCPLGPHFPQLPLMCPYSYLASGSF